MSVIWSATSPESGRFSPALVRSEPEQLERHFDELLRLGHGYLELERADADSPQLTLGFRGENAVIHLLEAGDDGSTRSLLLVGDETLAPDAIVEVPIGGDPARFTGDFVMKVGRAWDVVRSFIQAEPPGGLGYWHEL